MASALGSLSNSGIPTEPAFEAVFSHKTCKRPVLRYPITKRSYGALSTTFRKRVGWIEAPPVSEPPPEAFTLGSPSPASVGIRGARAQGPQPTQLGPSEEESDFTRNRQRNWARLIAKTYLCDPERCPSCGERMKIVAAISSPRQDVVIEKILRHLNLWAPPWKRERKARGPPPRRPGEDTSGEREEPSCAEPIDPDRDIGQYAVDPPWVDDL